MNLIIFAFWLTFVASLIIIPFIIDFLDKKGMYRRVDRKNTLYNTEAVEFNSLREKEENTIKKARIPRVGGLALFAVFVPAGLSLALILGSKLLLIMIFCVSVATLIAIYDDLIDIGVINRSPITIKKRFFFIGASMIVYGWSFWLMLPNTITLLPFPFFENVYVGAFIIFLFPAWILFWQASSVIDGIDGLSGTVFLILYLALGLVSALVGNILVLMLMTISVAILLPWLFYNNFPAQAYLTETGMTFLLAIYSVATFMLALGSDSGVGIWIAFIFGGVLIATWVSNLLQMYYRKVHGRKLFRVAPLHHHFEVLGFSGGSIVVYYMIITIVLVLLGITIAILI